jgi:hypothetical protein
MIPKTKVLQRWREWSAEYEAPTIEDVSAFCDWLKKNDTDALDFRYRGDRCQQVRAWVLESDPRVTQEAPIEKPPRAGGYQPV